MDYNSLNEKAQKQLRRQKTWMRGMYFAISVFLFVLFTILSIIDLTTHESVIMMLVGWIVTMVFFATTVASDSGVLDNFMRKQVLAQAVTQAMLERAQAEMLQVYEKPKRNELTEESLHDEVLELGDDGELVPVRRKKKS